MFDKKKYHREYNKAHRDQLREANKRYREKNREKLAEKTRKFHKDNPDYQRDYYFRRGKALARLRYRKLKDRTTNEPL